MTIVSRRGLVFKRQIRHSSSSSVAADGVVLKKGADLKNTMEEKQIVTFLTIPK